MSAPLVEIEGVEVRLGGRPLLSGVSLAHREDLVPAIGHVLELTRGRAVFQGPRSAWSSPDP